jgi:hypothetical protein
LKALKDRHLFLPRGTIIPASVQSICSASVDLQRVGSHWEQIVHLVASVHSGHTSAVHVTARVGSASRGDPFYEAVVHTAHNQQPAPGPRAVAGKYTLPLPYVIARKTRGPQVAIAAGEVVMHLVLAERLAAFIRNEPKADVRHAGVRITAASRARSIAQTVLPAA